MPLNQSRDPRMVRFIVNADDLGGARDINEAIFALMSDGAISSSTIMATGPALDDAIAGARDFPSASFGVHLNVTDHAPLTRNPDLGPLLDAAGMFRRNAVYEVHWTNRLIAAVAKEWTAQVNRISAAGVSVSHLDSHHHTHTVPALFVALKRVQWSTGIRRVRGTWSVYDREHMASPALRAKKFLWQRALGFVLSTKSAAEFAGFLMFLRAVEEGTFAPRQWPSVIELMVHPGPSSEAAEEADVLRSDWLQRLPVDAAIASYWTL
jgi:predicted glycoside hydrolase/deacetylase ChbG (UPF0249 family)